MAAPPPPPCPLGLELSRKEKLLFSQNLSKALYASQHLVEPQAQSLGTEEWKVLISLCLANASTLSQGLIVEER